MPNKERQRQNTQRVSLICENLSKSFLMCAKIICSSNQPLSADSYSFTVSSAHHANPSVPHLLERHTHSKMQCEVTFEIRVDQWQTLSPFSWVKRFHTAIQT